MATCGSLQHIFDNPIPENPSSLIESLSSSWKQIKPLKPAFDHSFTEIFGELHFKENLINHHPNHHPVSSSSASLSSFPLDSLTQVNNNSGLQDGKWAAPATGIPFSTDGSYHKKSESFSSMKSESLQLCTEGLGFESLDNSEDLKIEFQETCENHDNSSNNNNNENNNDNNNNNNNSNNNDSNNNNNNNSNNDDKDNSLNFNFNSSYTMKEKFYVRGHSNHHQYYSKGRTNRTAFPPPISCIGRTGKPWVCFQSFRQDGRFVLNEIRIPTQEFLHAQREDGRLRLCFVQPSEQEDDAGEEGIEGEPGVVGKLDAENDQGEEHEENVKGKERAEKAEIKNEFEMGNS